MKNITKICAFAAVSLTFMVAACGDDETTSGPSGPSSSSGQMGGNGGNGDGGAGGGGNVPPKPNLGGQIDRMGRAAIATATYERFTDGAAHDSAVDAWNANGNAETWVSTYLDSITNQIAILDGLDGCGDNLVYANAGAETCPAAGNDACYGLLATVLANDWITIHTAGDTGTGAVYLGVEANFTGLIVNDSTGGRHPDHDVIATSYQILAGDVAIGLGFDDGITSPTPAVLELFPYLAPAL